MWLIAGLVLIFAGLAVNGWRIDRHHNTAVRFETAVRAAAQVPLDERDIELWARQVMAADTDTIIREASR